VLFNLIDNAIQHTDPGGYIELRWMLAEQAVVVSVSDHGEELPQKIYRMFLNGSIGETGRARSVTAGQD
jgi:signal transduction histidine kinase